MIGKLGKSIEGRRSSNDRDPDIGQNVYVGGGGGRLKEFRLYSLCCGNPLLISGK